MKLWNHSRITSYILWVLGPNLGYHIVFNLVGFFFSFKLYLNDCPLSVHILFFILYDIYRMNSKKWDFSANDYLHSKITKPDPGAVVL